MATTVEARHDFAAKLRQESLMPRVTEYAQWQRSVRAARAAGTTPPPIPHSAGPMSINLDLTTACNYACTHCIDWDMLNSKAKYQHDELLRSLDNLIARGLRSVILIGGGEPTLYPKFADVVRYLKTRNIQVGIVSNGSRNERVWDIVPILSQKDWVRYSLDSGTTATFIQMHRPKKPITLEDICGGVARIRELNPAVQVGFSFIIVWGGAEREESIKITPNIKEMVAAAVLARKSGFTYISFKPFLTRHPEGAEVMDTAAVENFNATVGEIRAALAEAKTLETPDFKVVESTNLRVLLDGSWRDYTKQPSMCHMMFFRQVQSPLGIYNCPAHRGEVKALVRPGSAYKSDESVAETHRSVAMMLENFDASHECREVTCLYHSANHMLERLVAGTETTDDITTLPDREDYYL